MLVENRLLIEIVAFNRDSVNSHATQFSTTKYEQIPLRAL